MSRVRVTLKKSPFGRLPKHRATVEGLGLHRVGHTVEHDNNDQIQGMIRAINYLLEVEEISQ